MRIIVFGGDGFCGWPTALHLGAAGHEILIIDNLSRRAIDDQLSSGSLTKIASIAERVAAANSLVGTITFKNLDVAAQPDKLREVIREFMPEAVVHFAEQRAAPFSMISDLERRYTVDNNVNGTHNICSAIVDINPDIHLVHLGTMGVYGYNKAFGAIPEGYLDISVSATGEDASILYPANPGSVYHLTKCLDQLVFQFYNKNWGLRVTDLHQGIVWGVETEQTKLHESLVNRFDYDGVYGTVLNRFISQAANNFPLTVYGSGGQSRAFIHIQDSARCVQLAIESADFANDRVRIFNQVAEVHSVLGLAKILEKQYNAEIETLPNPRKELAENDLEVANDGLKSLGFEPIKLDESLVNDVRRIALETTAHFNQSNVLTSPKW